MDAAAGWLSSRTKTFGSTTLAVVPVEITTRDSEDSLSFALHSHAVRIVCGLATSEEDKHRIPDEHLMQMGHQCYAMGYRISFNLCCAETGVVFQMLVTFDEGFDDAVSAGLGNAVSLCVTWASGSAPVVPEIGTRSPQKTIMSHVPLWQLVTM